jgi:hypothetical protein
MSIKRSKRAKKGALEEDKIDDQNSLSSHGSDGLESSNPHVSLANLQINAANHSIDQHNEDKAK